PIGTYGSLVCSDQSVLYMINNSTYEIYSYDIINDSMQTVAYIGFSTPGDLTFYKGNLVFPTHTANSSIKAYNLQTNMVSDVYCLNNWGDMSNFFSFTNRFLDCNTNEIIGSDITGMYVFNLENDTYMPLGIDVSQHYIYGLASDNEYMASACYESLTPSNCQLSTAENPVQEYSVFPNPATDFIEITSNGIMQEIAIIDLSGRVISRLENPPPTINLISLASGCYVMKMKIDGRHHAQKFIKQ
ncbi:MAG TPA: T9SS type A sorting domain-containing protein, partial [Flavobacterium sp.]